MRISGSLVLYHNPPNIFAESIASFLADSDGRLVVVDNSRSPISHPLLHHERVTHLHRGDNPGFGRAHNLAFETFYAQSDLHLILNPDIRFQPGTLKHLAEVMAANTSFSAIMPKIEFPDGSTQHLAKLLPTPVDLLLRRFFPFPAAKAKHNARYELHTISMSRIQEVPSISGCFLLARTSLLQQIGGFDPRFFMYMEDVDLVRRLGDHGQIMFDPRVSVTHDYGKGSYQDRRLLGLHLKSAMLYFLKWGFVFDRQRQFRNHKILAALSQPADAAEGGE